MATKTEQPATSHWFVTSGMSWETGEDLQKCLTKCRRRDKEWTHLSGAPDIHIWLVPVPASEDYEIDNYTPQVKGAKFIGHCDTSKNRE